MISKNVFGISRKNKAALWISKIFLDIRNCFLDIQNNYFEYPKKRNKC